MILNYTLAFYSTHFSCYLFNQQVHKHTYVHVYVNTSFIKIIYYIISPNLIQNACYKLNKYEECNFPGLRMGIIRWLAQFNFWRNFLNQQASNWSWRSPLTPSMNTHNTKRFLAYKGNRKEKRGKVRLDFCLSFTLQNTAVYHYVGTQCNTA